MAPGDLARAKVAIVPEEYSTAVQVAHTRGNQPYLAVTNDEGAEVATVHLKVDPASGEIAIVFNQYADRPARFVVVDPVGGRYPQYDYLAI
ncbi:hypothetical protein ACM0AZ_24955 [Mycobacteroides abscessus subsp. massiliense]|uniref:hypothetical protein n=1 Tax=Mycobacteroides abscessus TaxID=36809 RepID=UPI0019D0C0A5|nr:hypothetical protein [Mycobacteroides abscessus]MBN7567084.1 hypothetical protein [Mycobacteroides abscessus subsp. massiliense]